MATRWGIVSAGKICHDFVTALGTLSPDEHRVVAVAGRDLNRARDFAKLYNIPVAYDSYQEIAENPDIDVIYIGSINTQHYAQCKMMIEAGKHVLCEKPLALNYRQAKKLTDLAKSKRVFFMEAVWSRFFPVYDVLREELESGSLGDVQQVMINLGVCIENVERVMKKELGGGSILDLGVYVLQLAELVYGPIMPREVQGVGNLNADGVDTNISAVLKYEGDKVALISTHISAEFPNEAFIIGTKGTVKIPYPFWAPTSIVTPTKTKEFILPSANRLPFFFLNSVGLRYEAEEVRFCLQKGLLESPKMTHADSLIIAQLQDKLRDIVGVHFEEDNN